MSDPAWEELKALVASSEARAVAAEAELARLRSASALPRTDRERIDASFRDGWFEGVTDALDAIDVDTEPMARGRVQALYDGVPRADDDVDRDTWKRKYTACQVERDELRAALNRGAEWTEREHAAFRDGYQHGHHDGLARIADNMDRAEHDWSTAHLDPCVREGATSYEVVDDRGDLVAECWDGKVAAHIVEGLRSAATLPKCTCVLGRLRACPVHDATDKASDEETLDELDLAEAHIRAAMAFTEGRLVAKNRAETATNDLNAALGYIAVSRLRDVKPVGEGRPYREQSAEWRAGYDEAEATYHDKQREMRRELRQLRSEAARPAPLCKHGKDRFTLCRACGEEAERRTVEAQPDTEWLAEIAYRHGIGTHAQMEIIERLRRSDATSDPLDAIAPRPSPDRAAWLLSPVSSIGRLKIDAGQYEELRVEACALRIEQRRNDATPEECPRCGQTEGHAAGCTEQRRPEAPTCSRCRGRDSDEDDGSACPMCHGASRPKPEAPKCACPDWPSIKGMGCPVHDQKNSWAHQRSGDTQPSFEALRAVAVAATGVLHSWTAGTIEQKTVDGGNALRRLDAAIVRADDDAQHDMMLDRPWSLPSIVEKLADAADHLLKDHDCDAHGWEEVTRCRNEARAWLQRRESPQPKGNHGDHEEGKEGKEESGGAAKSGGASGNHRSPQGEALGGPGELRTGERGATGEGTPVESDRGVASAGVTATPDACAALCPKRCPTGEYKGYVCALAAGHEGPHKTTFGDGRSWFWPNADAPEADARRGLYGKYIVERRDGSGHPGGKHGQCDYFVLDLVHDEHAPAALRAYADSCSKDFPQLAADLRARFSGDRDGTSDRREGGSEGTRGVDRPEEVAGRDDAPGGRRGGADGAVRGAERASEAGRPEHGGGDAERVGVARVQARSSSLTPCIGCGTGLTVRVWHSGKGPYCAWCDEKRRAAEESSDRPSQTEDGSDG